MNIRGSPRSLTPPSPCCRLETPRGASRSAGALALDDPAELQGPVKAEPVQAAASLTRAPQLTGDLELVARIEHRVEVRDLAAINVVPLAVVEGVRWGDYPSDGRLKRATAVLPGVAGDLIDRDVEELAQQVHGRHAQERALAAICLRRGHPFLAIAATAAVPD